ncbi:hypothetical protein ACVB9L_10880, partial [Rothia kristinae]
VAATFLLTTDLTRMVNIITYNLIGAILTGQAGATSGGIGYAAGGNSDASGAHPGERILPVSHGTLIRRVLLATTPGDWRASGPHAQTREGGLEGPGARGPSSPVQGGAPGPARARGHSPHARPPRPFPPPP